MSKGKRVATRGGWHTEDKPVDGKQKKRNAPNANAEPEPVNIAEAPIIPAKSEEGGDEV